MSGFERAALPDPGLVFPDEATARLYQRALSEQWHLERDVDWQALTLDRIARPIREAMGAIYSYILYGESFGLSVCGRVVGMAPAGWVRQFAATQVMDEARHVEFFSRVVAQLGQTQVPAPLVQLGQELVETKSVFELMLHAQVAETSAQTLFVETARRSRAAMQGAIRLPGTDAIAVLVDTMMTLVGRDEARHIAYGMRYLEDRIGDYSAADRRALESRSATWCRLYQAAFSELAPAVARLGFPMDTLLRRVWQVQRHQFQRLHLEIGELELPARPVTDG